MINEDTDEVDDLDVQVIDVPMLASSTIAEVEDRAMALLIDAPEADLQNWLILSSVLSARAKLIRQRIEQLAIKWIETNGPIVAGDLQYTVGYRKAVRCVDRQRTLDLILESSGGDLNALLDHLRADPYKYGSVRGLIGESNYKDVFKSESRPKLHCGSPQIELLAINTRYLRPKASTTRQSKSKAISHVASQT
jgi:hypothetical protein